ncbi:MAG: tRNA (N(6)-L-threonylcarbamoyladenosine(37)-C(2))-methylthiotransferase MtaB [Clostridiales bacterium]|jgi:threonylcarbamoyladenosine tRNA methylthiotransferase MtaB|nr:tRNA (N(6)-L-threonylcarbamoyladenosine(37)-C(2))-methylthiotransferase MtaB [Clostridiales bacterium]
MCHFKKVYFINFGCKTNFYETSAIIDIFMKNDYEISNKNNYEICVINTCSVTELSAFKCIQKIRKEKRRNPYSILAVVGCLPQTNLEKINKMPEIDIILGTSNKYKILEKIEEFSYNNNFKNKTKKIIEVNSVSKIKDYEELNVLGTQKRTRANIKIQEGCNNFCTYCIIPKARGPSRSRKNENILKEITKFIENDYKEIVLTGTHISSYGENFKNKNTSLINILEQIEKYTKIERVRLSSLEPNIITDDFILRIKKLKNLCPHFHLSLQSGCDETLKRMGRKYTTYEYEKIVQKLREKIKDVAITTDIIVGFPGEDKNEFDKSYNFVKKIRFARIHVFKYSKRNGTKAFNMPNHIDEKEKVIRSKKFILLSSEMRKEFYERYIGKNIKILIEKKIKEETYFGNSKNYLGIIIKSKENIKNKIVTAKTTKFDGLHLIGDLI